MEPNGVDAAPLNPQSGRMKVPASAKIFDSIAAAKAALAGAALAKFKMLVKSPEATPEDFFAILSATSVVAIMIASGKMPTGAPEFILRELKPLRELIFQEIPDLDASDSFKRAVAAATESLGGLSEKSDGEKTLEPRSIAAVSTAPLLFGASEPLIPVLRIVLQADPPGANFEFFANTEELTSITAAFLQNLAQMLEQRAPLASKGIVKIIDPAAVAKMIGEMEGSLQKLKHFAPEFGILLDGPIENAPHPDASGQVISTVPRT